MKTILFICTGNIFRSMIAEHALRAALGKDAPYLVRSAGTTAQPIAMYPPVRDRLIARGIDPSGHTQTRLTADVLDAADLPVAMGQDHQAFVQEQFGRAIPLFNRICFEREVSVLDLGEALPGWQSEPGAAEAYTVSIVDTIWDAMPAFIRNLPRYLSPSSR